MKTSELTGALLDYWVARAEGLPLCSEWNQGDHILIGRGDGDLRQWSPSQLWGHGGPLIERERIELVFAGCFPPGWMSRRGSIGRFDWTGQTPLIAAMRAYVASKFGEDVPDEVPA